MFQRSTECFDFERLNAGRCGENSAVEGRLGVQRQCESSLLGVQRQCKSSLLGVQRQCESSLLVLVVGEQCPVRRHSVSAPRNCKFSNLLSLSEKHVMICWRYMRIGGTVLAKLRF